jgi:hypothetical protein
MNASGGSRGYSSAEQSLVSNKVNFNGRVTCQKNQGDGIIKSFSKTEIKKKAER